MTTPASPNSISLNDVQLEFGGANPIYISEYYAGGTNVPAGIAGIPTTGEIGLADFRNKTKVNVTVTPSSSNVSEAGGTLTFTVLGATLPNGTYNWRVEGGTASPSDFVVSSGTLTLTTGVGSFDIQVIYSSGYEGNETFRGVLLNTSNVVLAYSSYVNIIENPPSYTIFPSTYAAIEGDTISYEVWGFNTPANTVLKYNIISNDMNSGDFSTPMSGNCAALTAVAGGVYSTNYITIVNDNDVEVNPSVTNSFSVEIYKDSIVPANFLTSFTYPIIVMDRAYLGPQSVRTRGDQIAMYLGRTANAGETYTVTITGGSGGGSDSIFTDINYDVAGMTLPNMGAWVNLTFNVNSNLLFTAWINYSPTMLPPSLGAATSAIEYQITNSSGISSKAVLYINNIAGTIGTVTLTKYGGGGYLDSISVYVQIDNPKPYGYDRYFNMYLSFDGGVNYSATPYQTLTLPAYASSTGQILMYSRAQADTFVSNMKTQVRANGYIVAQANDLNNFYI